jgi:hypothetical protein
VREARAGHGPTNDLVWLPIKPSSTSRGRYSWSTDISEISEGGSDRQLEVLPVRKRRPSRFAGGLRNSGGNSATSPCNSTSFNMMHAAQTVLTTSQGND